MHAGARLICFLLASTGSPALAQIAGSLAGTGPSPFLPAPAPETAATKFSRIIGWPDGQALIAPAGFEVKAFARGLDSPRWLLALPGGDVLVAEAQTVPKSTMAADKHVGIAASGSTGASANRITLLRDRDRDGVAEERHVLVGGLNQPFGIALVDPHLYIANTDGLMRFPFTPGQSRIDAPGELVRELPAGGYNNHWTRNVIASSDGRKLYVTVGSSSNVAEHGMGVEQRRANILTLNPDGSGERIFAAGLRNPVGLAWEPVTGALWTAVNERDGLGDELVPDYITSVRDGSFYGWPYSYYGQNADPRRRGKRPDLVASATAPDFAMGAHTASLGIAFGGPNLPERYRGGALVTQRGSWNRSELAGYRVAFVPFREGRPSGSPEDFLTGFLMDRDSGDAYGRPVGIVQVPDGQLLVADDAGNTVWRVQPAP